VKRLAYIKSVEAPSFALPVHAHNDKGGDVGDSGDSIESKGIFLSPPCSEVVTGGDNRAQNPGGS
jgi:hypothetical protein